MPEPDFIFHGGCTLLIDPGSQRVRYVIEKSILDDERLDRQRKYLESDLTWTPAPGPRATTPAQTPTREGAGMAKRSRTPAGQPAVNPEPVSDDRLKVSPTGVVVRMYRQGLGDCFLLGIPGRGGAIMSVLIDCGVLMGTPNADATMRRVVVNIAAAVGGHLNVLVATHEHWDHLSGFLQARDVFEKLRIDEVWLPWTHDPNDEAANKLQQRRKAGRADLTLARKLLSEEAPKGADRAEAPRVEFTGTRTEQAIALIQTWTKRTGVTRLPAPASPRSRYPESTTSGSTSSGRPCRTRFPAG